MTPWPWRKREPAPAASEAEIEALIDSIEAALDANDEAAAEEQVDALAKVARTAAHRALLGAYLLTFGRLDAAIAELEPLADTDLPDDIAPVRDLALAECALEIGEPERAQQLLERLPDDEWRENGKAHWLLGLCHDHRGEPEKADAAFRAAEEVEPEAFPAPIAISPDEAEAIGQHVLASLPPKIRALIEEVPIVIDDLPPLATIRETRGGIAHDTLGLYSGVSLVDRGAFDPSGPPPMIQIFRRNLERFARDREELEEEIRITLLHELGHHLGLDEDDVDALGLG